MKNLTISEINGLETKKPLDVLVGELLAAMDEADKYVEGYENAEKLKKMSLESRDEIQAVMGVQFVEESFKTKNGEEQRAFFDKIEGLLIEVEAARAKGYSMWELYSLTQIHGWNVNLDDKEIPKLEELKKRFLKILARIQANSHREVNQALWGYDAQFLSIMSDTGHGEENKYPQLRKFFYNDLEVIKAFAMCGPNILLAWSAVSDEFLEVKILDKLPEKFGKDPEVILDLFARTSDKVADIDPQLLLDEEFLRKLVELKISKWDDKWEDSPHSDLFYEVGNEEIKDKELALKLAERTTLFSQFHSEELRNDREVMDKLLGKLKSYLNFDEWGIVKEAELLFKITRNISDDLRNDKAYWQQKFNADKNLISMERAMIEKTGLFSEEERQAMFNDPAYMDVLLRRSFEFLPVHEYNINRLRIFIDKMPEGIKANREYWSVKLATRGVHELYDAYRQSEGAFKLIPDEEFAEIKAKTELVKKAG